MSIKDIYQHMAAQGRNGDTMLAHINPQEAALLKSLGGSGTINPNTGLPEFFWNPIQEAQNFVSGVGDAFSGAVNAVGDLGQGVINTVSNLGSQIDDTVNKIPGGWGTVAAVTGIYFSPEIGAYINGATGDVVSQEAALAAANDVAAQQAAAAAYTGATPASLSGILPTTEFPLGAGVADLSGLATPQTGIYPGEGVPSGVPIWDKAYVAAGGTFDPAYAVGAGVADLAGTTAGAGAGILGGAGLSDILKYAGLAGLAAGLLKPGQAKTSGTGVDQTPVGAGLSPDFKPYRYQPYADGGITTLARGGAVNARINEQIRQKQLEDQAYHQQQYEAMKPFMESQVEKYLPEVLSSYNNDERMAREHLARDFANKGIEETLRSQYARDQFVLGQENQTMGNAKYAELQKKINALSPVASQADWQSRVNTIQPYGSSANAIYRDPTTGAGIGVYANPDNQNLVSSFRYFDPSGRNVDTSIFSAPELYENAEKYGINLKGVGALSPQLQQQKLGYLPGQLYPTTVNSETGIPETSNLGINFADITKNKMGTAYDWTQDPLAASKGPSAVDYINRIKAMTNRLGIKPFADGGITGLSGGGYNLGGYSDGGRLLRGPGDGVSDDIPATIGGKQPARLADGEFVIPARIVSEIGNGSTDAGARKLYQMMDRVQAARRKTMGKKKFAKNTNADKYLPV